MSSRRHQLGHIGPRKNTSEDIRLWRNTSRHIGNNKPGHLKLLGNKRSRGHLRKSLVIGGRGKIVRISET